MEPLIAIECAHCQHSVSWHQLMVAELLACEDGNANHMWICQRCGAISLIEVKLVLRQPTPAEEVELETSTSVMRMRAHLRGDRRWDGHD